MCIRDSSSGFTKQLEELGIQHLGRIPQRSNVQAQAEIAIRNCKSILLKINANALTSRNWDRLLPVVMSSINQMEPFNCGISRLNLFFNYDIYGEPSAILENPLKAQARSLQDIARHRIKKAIISRHLNPKQTYNAKKILAGMWCLLDAKLGQKNTQPGRHDIWLVEEIDENRVFVVIFLNYCYLYFKK